MANSVNTQILADGPRNTIIKLTGTLDTSDVSGTLADPATLMNVDLINGVRAATFRVVNVRYSIEDTLEVRLFWDATVPQLIEALTGRGKIDMRTIGGAPNPLPAGATGKITYATQGWAASAVLSFTVEVELVKTQANTIWNVPGTTVNGSLAIQEMVDLAGTIPKN